MKIFCVLSVAAHLAFVLSGLLGSLDIPQATRMRVINATAALVWLSVPYFVAMLAALVWRAF